VIRKAAIASAMVWALAVSCLRAVRLPNNFSKEHWLIDYRFGFVKRGLIGTLVSVVTGAARTRPTESLIDTLAIVLFVVFCAALVWAAFDMLRRSRWSLDVALALLVFFSSPFIVMSAHLIGYYDNVIIALTLLSLALVFGNRIWAGAIVQAIAMLVHENTLLVGFPVFCWACWRTAPRPAPLLERRILPMALPVAAFAAIVASQSLAPHRLERSLTTYLSGYPFVAATLGDVRVPHWITISFYDSYLLHAGHFQERILSQPMIALVLPAVVAILGAIFASHDVAAVSGESVLLLAVCLIPQAMHVMAWDTARIWTYAIVCALLLLWVDVEVHPARRAAPQALVGFCLIALVVATIGVTPLMDGLRDRFDVTTRLLMYAPVMACAVALARFDATPSGASSLPAAT